MNTSGAKIINRANITISTFSPNWYPEGGVVEPMMSVLENFESLIRQKVEKERWTHKQISDFLKRRYPGVRGLSVRSIERLCCSKNIHKTVQILERELDDIVCTAVSKVGAREIV